MSGHPFVDKKYLSLEHCLLLDRPKLDHLHVRIKQGTSESKSVERLVAQYQELWERSNGTFTKKLARVPIPEYPQDLPISAAREQVIAAIQQHQVVVVAGETGSGKTTQIPKFCLQLGRGVAGLIGHTQPRRIAARAVANRVADELFSEPGDLVGFQVRFQEELSPQTLIKVMTDGILLAEIPQDRLLLKYDTLIIDEAHERSLNIDFILGYLKQLLPRRPDLKIIIMSATIDTEKFSKHFDNAPILNISGRTYPVEIRYRPLQGSDADSQDDDQAQAVVAAVHELMRVGGGDILVFLASEREIRELNFVLRKQLTNTIEILPLFARLSNAEQAKIFAPHGRRRIVLSTNVAETSLTVPGIKYVIDAGFARVSRYSYRQRVQRLPIEKISRAAANQRSGRCGRTSAGVCIRLYAQDDFEGRDLYTEPEILRTNLASVILKMLNSGIGEVDTFSFIDEPDKRYVNDGYRLLLELHAVDEMRQLTPIGKTMARFPTDPRLARMLVAAEEFTCVDELLVIVAALAIQDPRDRPYEKGQQQKADQAHAAFSHESSDFLSYLILWQRFREQKKRTSKTQLRIWCQEHFIAFMRMREWEETWVQLASLVKECHFYINALPAHEDNIHKALLSGCLSSVGVKQEDKSYLGGHNKRFRIFPASPLKQKPPKWIMAAEIVETSQLFARTAAAIQPDWLITIADHVLTKSHSDPHWSVKRGTVVAKEKLMLYGIVIAAERPVDFARIDSTIARELFIRQALVPGLVDDQARFLLHNRACINELEQLEQRIRKHGYLFNEEALVQFYLQHLPNSVHDIRSLAKWLKDAPSQQYRSLEINQADIITSPEFLPSAGDYPDKLRVLDYLLPLNYCFDPDSAQDGIYVRIPLIALARLEQTAFDFLVPGLLPEKIEHLLRNLNKDVRRQLGPVTNLLPGLSAAIAPEKGEFYSQLSSQLLQQTGVKVAPALWRMQNLPEYLCIHFQIVNEHDQIIAKGDDLEALQRECRVNVRSTVRQAVEQTQFHKPVQTWDFGDLAESVTVKQLGVEHQAFPALEDLGDKVQISVFESAEQAALAMSAGLCKLFRLTHVKDISYLEKKFPLLDQIKLLYAPVGDAKSLYADLLDLVIRSALLAEGNQIRTQDAYSAATQRAVNRLMQTANTLSAVLVEALRKYQQVAIKLKALNCSLYSEAHDDIQWQLGYLVYDGFLTEVDLDRLKHYPRYLTAVERRLDKLTSDPRRDTRLLSEIAPWWKKYLDAINASPNEKTVIKLDQIHWLIEEYRVSLFAQELKTAIPVSTKRLREYWEQISNPA